jgi:hypothetical protein
LKREGPFRMRPRPCQLLAAGRLPLDPTPKNPLRLHLPVIHRPPPSRGLLALCESSRPTKWPCQSWVPDSHYTNIRDPSNFPFTDHTIRHLHLDGEFSIGVEGEASVSKTRVRILSYFSWLKSRWVGSTGGSVDIRLKWTCTVLVYLR